MDTTNYNYSNFDAFILKPQDNIEMDEIVNNNSQSQSENEDDKQINND
jgi:hypothetical protein